MAKPEKLVVLKDLKVGDKGFVNRHALGMDHESRLWISTLIWVEKAPSEQCDVQVEVKQAGYSVTLPINLKLQETWKEGVNPPSSCAPVHEIFG
jgi:hypothetical protein